MANYFIRNDVAEIRSRLPRKNEICFHMEARVDNLKRVSNLPVAAAASRRTV